MSSMLGFLLSVLFGFLPMLLLVGVIYWLDRYEKEPVVLLGTVFSWGAIVAVVGALVFEIALGQGVLMLTGSKVIEETVTSSLFAPIVEEALKSAAVLLVFLFFRSEFDSVLDGIVYASVVALGFAATEDVLYYFSSFKEGGLSALGVLVFLRFIVFGWQHAFFTSFTGIGLAVARLNRNVLVKIAAPLLGFSVSFLTHSLHNSLLTFLSGFAGLTVAAVFAWSGWLIMFAFILYLIYREKNWVRQYLREEVDLQVITDQQYQAASSFFGQTLARFASLGKGHYRATDRFYQLCGELSHKKRQLATLGDENGNGRVIQDLRAELSRISPML